MTITSVSACDDPAVYSCGCMSGYIRDWQTPTPIEEVRAEQIERCKDWLILFDRQGRKPDDHLRLETIKRLERLKRGVW